MSKPTDTGKAETVPESAGTKAPIWDAPLEGKVAIVTGGGRGLGRSMVLGLARAGAKVIATAAHERQELDRVAAEAPRDAVEPMIADVTDAKNCAALVGETLRRFGKLDILVNNAGRGMKYVSENFLTEPTRFWETDPEQMARGSARRRSGSALRARRGRLRGGVVICSARRSAGTPDAALARSRSRPD